MTAKEKTSTIIPGYRIERRIARGGMGSVYLARQESLNRRVAIKVLSGERDSDFNQRFINEARGIAELNHSNIVPIYDVGVVSNRPFFSMEYLAGGDLSRQIQKGIRPLTAAGIVARLARCLDFVHGRGVIHRDIKPANILFRRDKTPVLTDFGVARWQSVDMELTLAGSVIGSPFYVSPELARGETQLDGRTDIYSLGVVFYEMLTSRRPFVGDSVGQILLAHQTKPVPKLPARLTHWQPALDAMLAKNPEDRPASGVEVIDLLRSGGSSPAMERTVANHLPTAILGETALLSDSTGEESPSEDVESVKPGLLDTPTRWLREHYLPVAAVAGLLLAGIAAVLLSGGDDEAAEPATAVAAVPPPVVEVTAPEAPPVGITEPPAVEPVETAAAADPQTPPPITDALPPLPEAPVEVPDAPAPPELPDVAVAEPEDTEPTDEEITAAVDAAMEASDDNEPLDSLDEQALADLSASLASELPEDGEEPQPESPAGGETTVEISEADRLLALVSARTKALRLTSPRGDSAYDYLQQLSKLDPNHPGIARGYERIVQRYGALATRAVATGKLDDARRYLKRGQSIRPNSVALKKARDALHQAEVQRVKASMAARKAAQPSIEHRRAAQAAGAPVTQSETPADGSGTGGLIDWFSQDPGDFSDESFDEF